MITLTVDPKVEQELHRAFPRPANSAGKALGKYVKLLESMLLEAHVLLIHVPEQRSHSLLLRQVVRCRLQQTHADRGCLAWPIFWG
jgi:hypothetical protein